MLNARFEMPRNTDIGPLVELGLYDIDGKCEFRVAIVMHDNLQFTCHRMERGAVLQSTLGNVGGLKNYRYLAKSKMTVKEKKDIIHGQIALAVTDFVGIIYDLFDEDIRCPHLSKRFMDNHLEDYIKLCYRRMMNSIS